MNHEHSRHGPLGCKLCDSRRSTDFGQGSREQSFSGVTFQKIDLSKYVRA